MAAPGGLHGDDGSISFDLSLPDAPLVVVTAHHGAGKTTLLRHWQAAVSVQGDRRPLWVTVDIADNDLDHFSARIESAVGRLPGVVTVFLDDFETIRSIDSRRWLIEVVESGPAAPRFVVAQEHGVALPVARLRPDDLVAELGDADLRLGPRHIEQLLTDRDLSLTERSRSRLLAETEGWALGVATILDRLGSAPSASEDEVIDRVVDDLARSMVEVIESAVGDAGMGLLVATSIVSVLEADLCRHVAGADRHVDLDRLAGVTPFLSRVTGVRDRLRLHRLARRGLRMALTTGSHPDEIASCHLAAADWLEAAGELSAALGHCLAAGRAERAADLLAAVWSADPGAVGRREVESIGRAGAGDYVPHIVTAGLISEWSGDRAGLERAIDRLAGADWVGPLPHGFASLDSTVVALGAELPQARAAASLERVVEVVSRDEMATIEPQSLIGRSRAASAAYLLGRFDEAQTHAATILVGNRAVGRHTVADRAATVQASDLLALIQHDLGHVVEARRRWEHGDELAVAYGLSSSEAAPPAAPSRDLVRAVIGIDPVDVRVAMLTRLRGEGLPWIRLQAAVELVRLLDRERRVGEADEVLEELERMVGDDEMPPLLVHRVGLLRNSLRHRPRGPGSSIHVTAGERSVLYLIADSGLSQSEIGARLDLSINTVKSHLRSIYQKLGVAGRAEAVAHAAGAGLLVTVLPWGQPGASAA